MIVPFSVEPPLPPWWPPIPAVGRPHLPDCPPIAQNHLHRSFVHQNVYQIPGHLQHSSPSLCRIDGHNTNNFLRSRPPLGHPSDSQSFPLSYCRQRDPRGGSHCYLSYLYQISCQSVAISLPEATIVFRGIIVTIRVR